MRQLRALRSVRIRRALLSIAVILLCPAADASAQNQVSGSFTVNGVKTPFAYAYSYWKDSPFGAELMVLFSDVAIPPQAVPKDDDGVSALSGLVRAGKVHALELHLAPREKQLDAGENAAVFHVGLSQGRHGMTGMHVFAATTFTSARLEGTSHTDGPQNTGVPWQYEVTFRVALPAQGK